MVWLDETAAHEALDVAVHGHDAPVETVALIVVAGMHGVNATGATEYRQLDTSPD
jgi:hypothetical protein